MEKLRGKKKNAGADDADNTISSSSPSSAKFSFLSQQSQSM